MDTHGIVSSILAAHILAGALALLFGYTALSAKKGATLHRKSGMLFVFAPIAAMLYWLWRIRVKQTLRGIVTVNRPQATAFTAPDSASH